MSDRIKILDIWVDVLSKEAALKKVHMLLKKGSRAHSIFASNPEKCFALAKDPRLKNAYKNADLLIPDGIGLVWAARFLFGIRMQRLPGSEFFYDICELAANERYSMFIYGAKEKINRTAVDRLKKRYPKLNIAGRSNGYVKASDMLDLIDRINKSRAEILFLALGSPRQENWFAKYHRQLKYVKVCQCIGGTLDTIAGSVKRAPEIWQRCSLEWLYRLIIQPGRLKRQKVLPLFVLAVFKMKLKYLVG